MGAVVAQTRHARCSSMSTVADIIYGQSQSEGRNGLWKSLGAMMGQGLFVVVVVVVVLCCVVRAAWPFLLTPGNMYHRTYCAQRKWLETSRAIFRPICSRQRWAEGPRDPSPSMRSPRLGDLQGLNITNRVKISATDLLRPDSERSLRALRVQGGLGGSLFLQKHDFSMKT